MPQISILVIDDQPFICEMIVMMLQDCGYQITTTTDSRQGLALFEKNDYDIVFSDLRMPYLSGDVLVRRMKALKPTVPICLITATPEAIPADELSNFAAVIVKPFVKDNLTDAIDRALGLPVPLVHHVERSPRYPVNWRVDYVLLQTNMFFQAALKPKQTTLLNLGEGGIAIHTDEELPISSLAAFVIYPPRSDPFLVIGQIRWQREIDGVHTAGTQWLLWESNREKRSALERAYAENEGSVQQ